MVLRGGGETGFGSRNFAEFDLIQGTILKIGVGQKGSDSYEGNAGGGGTFVVQPPYTNLASILIISGGGAGYSTESTESMGQAYNSSGYSQEHPPSNAGFGGV
jgi:hypothetical protein